MSEFKGVKGFINVHDTMDNELLINVNHIMILHCDCRILLLGHSKEIELKGKFSEIKKLIKEATEL